MPVLEPLLNRQTSQSKEVIIQILIPWKIRMIKYQSAKHNNINIKVQQTQMEEMNLDTIASNAVSWLRVQECGSFKDITRTAQALALWADDDTLQHKSKLLIQVLQQSIFEYLEPRDFVRAIMAAAASGIR